MRAARSIFLAGLLTVVSVIAQVAAFGRLGKLRGKFVPPTRPASLQSPSVRSLRLRHGSQSRRMADSTDSADVDGRDEGEDESTGGRSSSAVDNGSQVGADILDHGKGEAGAECEAVGPCVLCDAEEMDLDYCKWTGRREEIRCSEGQGDFSKGKAAAAAALAAGGGDAGAAGGMGALGSSATFRACRHTDAEDAQELLRFLCLALVIGVIACVGMRKRQQKGASLYARRAK